jgi:hypothetical protein
VITHRFSVTDERHVRNLLGDTKKKCEYCRRLKTASPCESSDHGWNSLLMAMDDAQDSQVSSGCLRPDDHQAPCITPGARRHPTSTLERPVNSGWCVDPKCACDCHSNEPIPTDDLEEL